MGIPQDRMWQPRRRLGKSDIEVSALGLGCWPIGGPWKLDGRPVGRGQVDPQEAERAIRRALDLGVSFFDTAGSYGAGQSERILGTALQGRRQEVVLATKFGVRVDEAARTASRIAGVVLDNVRQDCEDSLRRLGTDWIDLFQLHVGDYPLEAIPELERVLEDLVVEGKIRAYGWCTDEVGRPPAMASGERCTAVQHELNVLTDAADMLATCEAHDLASIDKYPLLMGILAGRFGIDGDFPADDIRRQSIPVNSEKRKRWFAQLEAVAKILSEDGRTLAQGALGWIWARSDRTIPIPGFRTTAQVEENAAAMGKGPLSQDQMRRIDAALHRTPAAR
jgi:aryl-alcohol dehydrogenase-like predicted oxidoreductase